MMTKDIPNQETMGSILEAVADIKDNHLPKASNYEELERILNS